METERPHPLTPRRDRTSQGSKARNVMIHQYVQAARKRLEDINASIGPPNSITSTTTGSTSPTNTTSPRSSDTSNQVHEDAARRPSAAAQWPLKDPTVDQHASIQSQQAPAQPESEPHIKPEVQQDKGNLAKPIPIQTSKIPREGSTGPSSALRSTPPPAQSLAKSSTRSRAQPQPQPQLSSFPSAQSLEIPSNRIRHQARQEPAADPSSFQNSGAYGDNAYGQPPPSEYIPAPNTSHYATARPSPQPGYPGSRGHRGPALRYPTAPRFASSGPRPPRNPQYSNMPAGPHVASSQRPYRGDPRYMRSYAEPPQARIPANAYPAPEFVQMHRSEKSTDTTDNTLDLLDEYADETSSQVSGRTAQSTVAPPPASSSAVDRLKQASLGTLQKPVLAEIQKPVSSSSQLSNATNMKTAEPQDIKETTEEKTRSSPNHAGRGLDPIITTGSKDVVEEEDQLISPVATSYAPDSPRPVSPSPSQLRMWPPVGNQSSVAPAEALVTESSNRSLSPVPGSKFSTSPSKFLLTPKENKQRWSGQSIGEYKKPTDSAYSSPAQVDQVSPNGIRESTTSLHGLIMRNLKLASNLERGVTSSKFGIDWIIEAGKAGIKRSPAASTSSLIDSPPRTPAGEKSRSLHSGEGDPNTQTGAGNSLPRSGNDPFAHETDERNDSKRSRRRCCGLPLWAIVLASVLIVILVAVAIIIPVVLLVVPHQSQTSSPQTGTSSNTNDVCSRKLTCDNGGTVRSAPGPSCYCTCATGWTGPSCRIRDTQNCATVKLSDSSMATIGSNIPPLIKASKPEFGIPLDASKLVSMFYEAKMDCKSQNDLVSLGRLATSSTNTAAVPRGVASKSRENVDLDMILGRSNPSPVIDSPMLELRKASTSNGIAVAPSPTGSSTYGPNPTTTSTSPQSTAPATESFQKAVKFAQTAVLYIFSSTQKTKLADMAHVDLQNYLGQASTKSSGYMNPHVNLGHGWVANFETWSVYYSGVEN